MTDFAQYHPKPQQGFTIIEVLVTVIITSIFIFAFFQTYMVMESQRIAVARQARASDLAYSILRRYTVKPGGLTCSASAQTLVDEATDSSYKLGSSGRQIVRASAPNGCSGTDFVGGLVKIETTVRYDNDDGGVTHATFVR